MSVRARWQASTARPAVVLVVMSIDASGCLRKDHLCCAEQFEPFTITTSGGVGGWSQEQVSVDGTVVITPVPVGGKLRPADLKELRRVRTSSRLRREATNSDTDDRGDCRDGFTRTLVMGELRVSRYFCDAVVAPAFQRVLTLTSPRRLERLPRPPAAPGLPALALTRIGNTGSLSAHQTVTPARARNGEPFRPTRQGRPDPAGATRCATSPARPTGPGRPRPTLPRQGHLPPHRSQRPADVRDLLRSSAPTTGDRGHRLRGPRRGRVRERRRVHRLAAGPTLPTAGRARASP